MKYLGYLQEQCWKIYNLQNIVHMYSDVPKVIGKPYVKITDSWHSLALTELECTKVYSLRYSILRTLPRLLKGSRCKISVFVLADVKNANGLGIPFFEDSETFDISLSVALVTKLFSMGRIFEMKICRRLTH